jgi:hypothetical protein
MVTVLGYGSVTAWGPRLDMVKPRLKLWNQ